jgi:hypothetical protein
VGVCVGVGRGESRGALLGLILPSLRPPCVAVSLFFVFRFVYIEEMCLPMDAGCSVAVVPLGGASRGGRRGWGGGMNAQVLRPEDGGAATS